MRTLSISSDRKLFVHGSDVQKRMEAYGTRLGELHIIVFSGRASDYRRVQLSPHVWVYPTRSLSRWLYPWDAVRLGKRLPKPDVITTQDPFEAGLVGWRLARFFGAPLQMQIHTDFRNPFFLHDSWLNRVRERMARFLLPKADCVRVVSRRIAESLADIPDVPAPAIVPVSAAVTGRAKPGASAERNELRSMFPECDRIILVVARLTVEKDIPTALRALHALHETHPKTCLVVVGEGPQRRALERLTRMLGISDYVVCAGYDDLERYYRGADVLLVNSRYEGYGRVLIEAALSGVPIVTTDVGLVGEVLRAEDHVRTIPPADPVATARVLAETFENERATKERATAARTAAEAEARRDTVKEAARALEQCANKSA